MVRSTTRSGIISSRQGVKQQGVALITVLLVVALASVVAVQMASRQHMDIRRTSSRFALEQARVVSHGGERWAAGVLARDEELKVDSLDEDWATILPPLPVEGGQVSGYIEDMQGRFNLNNLLEGNAESPRDGELLEGNAESTRDRERLEGLLLALELEVGLADAILDWMDPDLEATGQSGAEDAYYTSLERPYRAANRPFTSVSELRLVNGVTAEVYDKLAPHVSALPPRTKINLNTATPPVLQALANHIGETEAKTLYRDPAADDTEPYNSVEEFLNNPINVSKLGERDSEALRDALAVNSNYFRSSVLVEIGRTRLQLRSLLNRNARGATRVVWRARGAD